LLPDLNEESLVEMAKYFDPTKPDIWAIISGGRVRSRSVSAAQTGDAEPPPEPNTVVEFFLETLLALAHTRGVEDQTRPWRLDTSELFDVGLDDSAEAIALMKSVKGEGGPAVETLQQLHDKRLSLGDNHGAAVVDGDVYTWGKATHGRLGLGAIVEEQKSAPWCRVETLHIHSIHVTGVACGAEHMFAFGNDGLYAWGNGANGRLGLGDEQNRNVPTEVRGVGRVRDVACGSNFSLALLAERSVLAWGGGSAGQLGTGSYEDQLRPSRVTQVDGLHGARLCTMDSVTKKTPYTLLVCNQAE
jgi:hypothetical protein